MEKQKSPGDFEKLRRILKMIWEVFFPLLAYYLMAGTFFLLLNMVVQNTPVNNGIGMLLAAFCLRRYFLSEVCLNGEPVMISQTKLFAGLLREEGRQFRSWWKGSIAVLLLAIASSVSLNLLAELIQAAQYSAGYQETVQIQYSVSFVTGLLLYGVISPLAEEMIFRGIIYRKCRRYLGILPGILLSSILFAILHGNLVQGVYAFIMGMLICSIYEKYHSFLAPVLFHSVANVTAFSVSYFGIPETAERMSVNCLIFTIISAALVFLILFSKKN